MKKVLAIVLSMVMALGLLAGCGSTSQSAEQPTGGSSSQEETESKENGDINVRVILWDYSNVSYFKEIFAAFEESHPGIKVDVVEASAAEYDDLIQVKLSSKENYDVVFTKTTSALSALIAKGHIMALDDFISNDTEFDKSKYAGLVDQLSLDGKIYGVPFRKDNNLLFYNKDLFDAKNVEYPKDGMTMDEFYELAKQMTYGEGAEKVYGAHYHTWPGCVSNAAKRAGVYTTLDDNVDSLKPYYETVLKMQDEGLIMDYGELKATNTHYSGVFYNQQVAMMPIGTWYINMLMEHVDFNWGVCSLPTMDGMANEEAAIGGVTPVSIGAYAAHPQEAWELIKYLTGEEGAKILADCGILPGYSSPAVNEIFDGLAAKKPGVPENLSKYINIEKHVMEEPMSPTGREVSKLNDEEHSLIMTNSISLEDGLSEWNDRLAELKK